MPPANARGSVEEQVGNRHIAQPSARGGQLVDFDVLGEGESRQESAWQGECGRLFDIRGAVAQLDAADDLSPLPIVAELATDQPPFRVCVGWCDLKQSTTAACERRVEGRVPPAVAAVNTDIEPGPIRHVDRDR